MHLKGNSYTLPFLWNSVGTFSSAVNHTTCIFKVSKHRHAGVKFMKKYFIQLYGNCDSQRCWSDLKLVLTFGTPTFSDIFRKYSHIRESAMFCALAFDCRLSRRSWGKRCGCGDPLSHTQEKKRESQWVIEKYCITVLGTGAEGKFLLFTEGKFFSVYSSQGLEVK